MPVRGITDVSFVKRTLEYPIFAADFDPYNRGYLVVGGGGGEGGTGVPNQISVLDISKRGSITTAVDIELSRGEDSVQCVANLASKDGLIIFAGINSSQAEQDAGKNEHLRSFSVKYPPRKKSKTDEEEKGEWKLLGKKSLFNTSKEAKNETYQRILRLSPPIRRESGANRIGAIATGMTKESQIVVFNATTSTPESADIITRIDVDDGLEANDLDITSPDDSEFSLAYCTDSDIYEQSYKYDFQKKGVEKTPRGPRRVYQMPSPDTSKNPGSRLKFRSIRFLNAQNVITLLNKPNKRGAELRIFHLYPTGPATLIQEKALPSHIKQATCMDICNLDADAEGNFQIVVAVAGQDRSIEIFTTNYQRKSETFGSLNKYLTIRNVHQLQMTKICFSPFHAPSAAQRIADGEPPMLYYIRLASVSLGNSVVVDTFPLQRLHAKDQTWRYGLSSPTDEMWAKYAYLFIGSIVALVVAFLVQAFGGGFGEDAIGLFSLLPKSMRQYLDRPTPQMSLGGKTMLRKEDVEKWLPQAEILPSGKSRLQSSHPKQQLVLRPDADSSGVSFEQHADKGAALKHDKDAKHWHELSDEQKGSWKEKLKRAGEWVESEGEGVLLGVLFSEYAGAVAQGVADIAREL